MPGDWASSSTTRTHLCDLQPCLFRSGSAAANDKQLAQRFLKVVRRLGTHVDLKLALEMKNRSAHGDYRLTVKAIRKVLGDIEAEAAQQVANGHAPLPPCRNPEAGDAQSTHSPTDT